MDIAGVLSEAQTEKLKAYVDLLDKWRRITDLISENGFAHVWQRHVADSVRLLQFCPDARLWLDIGSGAGFPAVVIAVLLAQHPEAQVHCVESDGRKCAFLRAVASRLQIPLKVHNMRMEALRPQFGKIDVVTARAFSTVERILTLADPYLRDGAIALLPRGETSKAEVEQLDRTRYALTTSRNPGEDGGIILQIAKRRSGSDG